jgi:hypothetical protein
VTLPVEPRCKCGRSRSARHPSRCEAGHALPGGDVGQRTRFPAGEPGPALRHGARSALVRSAALPEQAELRAALAERERAVLTDAGGAEDATEVRKDLTRRFVEASTLSAFLFDRIATLGPFGTSGRLRPVVPVYLKAIETERTLALALGLERKARPVKFEDLVNGKAS